MRRTVTLLASLLLLAACQTGKKEEEASKDTFACQLNGERFVVRFAEQEARLLFTGGERVNLYQVGSDSGVRYTNGMMELRGKGSELTLIRDGQVSVMKDCAPVMVPKS
jgi:membrane-bound inhibitor of C-type lysozyme